MKGFATNKPVKALLLAMLGLTLLAGSGVLLSKDVGVSIAPIGQSTAGLDFGSLSFHESEIGRLARPIGVLSGKWHGQYKTINVTMELDSKVPTINFDSHDERSSISVVAEFSRKGRIITVGQVSCIKPLTLRVQSLAYTGCPLVQSGNIFTINVLAGRMIMKGRDGEVTLSRE